MEPELLSAARKAGNCRVGLVLERGWVPWYGQVEGKLVLQGSIRDQLLLGCDVSLMAPVAGSDSAGAVDTRRWDGRTVESGAVVELDFSLKMGWGVGFGPVAEVRASVTPSAFLTWPHSLSLPIEVTPPLEFVRAGTDLAEITGFELEMWSVIMAGDGAAVSLRPRERTSPLLGIDLRLFRSPERDYGELVLRSRGALRRIQVRLPREDPDAARRILLDCLEPVLSATEALPIPSRAEVRTESLPLPSDSAAPEGRALPRPSSRGPSET